MSEYIKRSLQLIKQSKVFIIISLISFIIGCILGIFFSSDFEGILLYDNLINNYIIIFSVDESIFLYSFTKLLSFALIGVILFLSSLSIYTYFINCIIFLYQGFIFVAIIPYLYCAFSIIGIVVFIITILPAYLFRFLGECLLSALNCYISINLNKYKKHYYLLVILVFFMFVIIAFLWELITIGVIIRPLNFYL